MTAKNEPLTFGVSLPNRAVLLGLPVERLIEVSEQAEASGLFDSVWVGDNFLSKPRLEAIVTLSGLATRTKRLKLGVICLATFPLRQPVQLAIQWASLDVLSGGRTLLAVCLGGGASKGPEFAAELVAMQMPSNERAPRLEEGIELLRRFWGPEPVTHEGRFYRFENVEVYPKPVQQPLPIILATNPPPGTKPHIEERALRRVGRLADGWQTDGTPPAVFRDRWNRIREYAAEYGRPDAITHNSLHLMVNIDDDADRARRESIEFLGRYYGMASANLGEEKLSVWLAAGPPSAIVDRIGEFVEAGCTTPVLRFTDFDPLGQLERCVTEVLPAFKPSMQMG